MRVSKKVLIGSTALLMFVITARPVVFAAQPEYSTIRMKFFHLLNLVGGEEAPLPGDTTGPSSPTGPTPTSGPAAPPLATPTPLVKNTIIAYKGKQIGTAKYDPVTKYQMNIEIPEFFDTTVDYYGWVKKTNPDAIVRLASDPLPGFTNLSIVNSQDLTDYTEFLISEEKKGLPAPTTPSNVKYSGTQTPVIPSTAPTSATTPASTTAPTGGSGSSTGTPAPTGQPGSILDQMKAVSSAITATNIQEYLIKLANKEGQSDEKQTRFSGSQGSQEEQAYITKFFQDLGYEVDTSQTYSYTYGTDQLSTKNIIARLNGQKTDSFYLVTAHMDSTAERDGSRDPAPGVDDNGSGTVSVMEIARAFKTANIQPQYSIEFILFSGEEQGLHGSKNYVSRLTADKKIKGVMNLDMIGNIDPAGDCVNFYFKPGSGGNLISDAIVQAGKDIQNPLKMESKSWNMTRSDHGPFWNVGINTAIFGHECKSGADGGVYHSLADKMNAVSISQIAKATQVVGAALVKVSQEGIGQQVSNDINMNVLQDFQSVLGVQTENGNGGTSQQPAYVKSAEDEESSLTLAVVAFKDLVEIDRLYQNTTSPIDYLMGEDVDVPQFLGLFTDEQLNNLKEIGYEPRVVEQNANLSNYVLLNHQQPNQGDKLQDLGEVFEITPHYFFVKIAPGKTYTHEGVLGEFFDLTLPKDSSPPPYRTIRITLAPTPTDIPVNITPSTPAKSGSFARSILFVIGALLIFGIFVAVFIVLFKYLHKVS